MRYETGDIFASTRYGPVHLGASLRLREGGNRKLEVLNHTWSLTCRDKSRLCLLAALAIVSL